MYIYKINILTIFLNFSYDFPIKAPSGYLSPMVSDVPFWAAVIGT